MKKRVLLIAAVVLLVAGGVQAALITSISASDMDTSFDGTTLSISDNVVLVVSFDDDSLVPYFASFEFSAIFEADTSSGGTASATFYGGSYSIVDSNTAEVLLSGDVLDFELSGTFATLLHGPGNITFDAGSLMDDMPEGYEMGRTATLLFDVEFVSFQGDFAGQTNMTVLPIPEPATLALLGIGAVALLRRK